MKSKKPNLTALITACTIVLLTGFSSCGEKDKEPSPASQFSATLNNKAFTPTFVNGFKNYEYITLYGIMPTATDSLQLEVSIADTATINSKLTFENEGVAIRYVSFKGAPTYSSWAWYAHGSATLTTVDKANKKLAGTFNGVLYRHSADLDSIVITNGQFNTSYN